MTLTEVSLSLGLSALLLSLGFRTASRMSGVQTANSAKARLHNTSQSALTTIVSDLQRALYRTVPGAEMPYVFDDGVAVAPYTVHSHTPAPSEAVVGEPDFGPNREIVFVLPKDANGDGRPDLAGNQVVWSTDQICYRVVTHSGSNALVRAVNGATESIVARHVERVVFDTPASSGFTIPLGMVRVRLFLRFRDEAGELHTHRSETLVRLQRDGT